MALLFKRNGVNPFALTEFKIKNFSNYIKKMDKVIVLYIFSQWRWMTYGTVRTCNIEFLQWTFRTCSGAFSNARILHFNAGGSFTLIIQVDSAEGLPSSLLRPPTQHPPIPPASDLRKHLPAVTVGGGKQACGRGEFGKARKPQSLAPSTARAMRRHK